SRNKDACMGILVLSALFSFFQFLFILLKFFPRAADPMIRTNFPEFRFLAHIMDRRIIDNPLTVSFIFRVWERNGRKKGFRIRMDWIVIQFITVCKLNE